MSKRKKWIFLIFTFIFSFLYLFFNNWELMQIKRGNVAPIMWNSAAEYNQKLLTFENPYREVDKFNISMTDYYVFPELNRIHFGFWYNKWNYNTIDDDTPRLIFSIDIIDNEGKVYPANKFIIDSDKSLFEHFQYRYAENLDINSVETLTIHIHLLKTDEDGDKIVETQEILIYDSKEDKLSEFNMK